MNIYKTMASKLILTLGTQNKKTLRTAFNLTNIREAYALYGVDNADDAYQALKENYNRIISEQIETENAKKKEQQKQKRAEAYKKKKAEKEEEKRVAQSVIYDRKFNEDELNDAMLNLDARDNGAPLLFHDILNRLSQMQKETITIMTSAGGERYKTINVEIIWRNIGTIYFNTLYNALSKGASDVDIITNQPADYYRIVITRGIEPIPKRLEQKYLDGEKHCVIEPLRCIFQKYADNSESVDSRRKFNGVIKKLNNFEKEYADGVPENDMEIIAKAINRCIIIHSITGQELYKYNSSCKKYVHFTNTRENHLEQTLLKMEAKEFIGVTKDEMYEKMAMHYDESGNAKVFFMTTGNPNELPQKLVSSLGSWIMQNDDYEVYNNFDKAINKKSYRFDASKYEDLNRFIFEGRIINASPTPLCDEPNNLTDVKHIDLTKAYTQHKLCEFYQGFLGHITNYGRIKTDKPLQWLEKHIGIYQFEVIKNPSKLIRDLGIAEKYIYNLPSCEIIALIKKWKLQIRLISGVFGSSFDFDYTPEMLENRRYAIWAGKNGISCKADRYNFPGTMEWAQHLRHEIADGKVYYNDDAEMICVSIARKHNYTYHHILAFITSYTRLNVLSVLDKIPEENRVKVILDGIYYRGEIEEVNLPHKSNALKEHVGFRQFWYYPSEIDCSEWSKVDERFIENAILAGAGGSGKTHTIYNCKSLIEPVYVVPTHVLGSQMREKYGCQYITINSLVGEDSGMFKCQSYKDQYGYEPATILIDELTMIKREDIEKALKMYPTSLILVAGDVDERQWYQCRNGQDGQLNELFRPRNYKYVHFTNDYRSKDEEIKKLKIDLRNEMKEIFAKYSHLPEDQIGGHASAMKLTKWILNNYSHKIISFEDAMKQFKSYEDVFIAGTHKTNEILLKNNCISGHLDKNKRINYNQEGTARGSFTIHSYQGLTIEDKKVYIALDMFEYAMLYTAISRCRSMEQLMFVHII